jgi:hypothetical protein
MALAGFKTAGSRVAVNAAMVQSLWLDLDCGDPEDPYQSRIEALIALEIFRVELGLPDPIIVNSGYSYHVYWPFTTPIEAARWTKLAANFKEATKKQGIKPDPHRTADITSVLRVPGTYNFKHETPALVKVIQWAGPTDVAVIETAILNYLGVSEVVLGFQNIECQIKTDNRDRDPEPIVTNCAQMRYAGGPNAHRDHWAMMLGVMRFCQGGLQMAHLLSQADQARYDAATLEEQFNSLGAGPPLCTTFEDFYPDLCLECKFHGTISTPVQLSDMAPPKPTLPIVAGMEPYSDYQFEVVPGQGLFQKDTVNEIVKYTLINVNEFYIDEIHVDTEDVKHQRFLKFKVRHDNSPFRTVYFSITDDMTGTGFVHWLGNHGLLPIKPKLNRAMREFMGSYIAKLQQKKDIIERKSHFGWTQFMNQQNGLREVGFVVGFNMYTASGPQTIALTERCERMARYEYIHKGSLENWKVVPDLYRLLGQFEGQLFMCASFAAPFMCFGVGTARNLIMNLWDARGGKGKSSLLRAVNSVWGHPTELVASKSDTLSARYQVLAIRKNLPYCMDELTTLKDTDLSNLLFDIANGREKRKSKSSGTELATTGSWETISFLTSNRSIYEIMRGISSQTVAESMRVIELNCQFENYSGTEWGTYIEKVISLMDKNYGLAGPQFINQCLTKYDDIAAYITDAAMDWDSQYRKHTDERFWTYGLGIILTVGRLAVELGYLNYDIDALESWIIRRLLPQMRRIIMTSYQEASDILTSYFNEHLDSTVVVKCARKPEVDTSNPYLNTMDKYIAHMPVKELHARLELDTRTFYVQAKDLERWCLNQRCSIGELLHQLSEAGKWKHGDKIKYTLGRGIARYSSGSVVCYRFTDMEIADDDFEISPTPA